MIKSEMMVKNFQLDASLFEQIFDWQISFKKLDRVTFVMSDKKQSQVYKIIVLDGNLT